MTRVYIMTSYAVGEHTAYVATATYMKLINLNIPDLWQHIEKEFGGKATYRNKGTTGECVTHLEFETDDDAVRFVLTCL